MFGASMELGCWTLFPIHLIPQLPNPLQLVKQSAPADTKRFGSLRAVELMLAQSLEDRLPFDFPQALGIGQLRRWTWRRLGRLTDLAGKVFGQNKFAP